MYHSSVRSTTPSTAKTALALVAIFSLLLTLFAIARPVAATHGSEVERGELPLVDVTDECIEAGFDFGFKLDNLDQVQEGIYTFASGDFSGSIQLIDTDHDEKGEVDDFVLLSADPDPDHIIVKQPNEGGGISHITFCFEEDVDGSLTLDKVAVGGDDEFAFTLGGQALANTLSGADPAVLLAETPGNYTIAEILTQAQKDAGWSLTSISCEGNATAEVVDLAAGTVAVTVGADEDVICTFTDTLVEQPPDGELEVDKFNCVGEDDDTIFFVFGPFSALQDEPDTTDCTIGAGVTFSVYTDAGAGVPGDFVLSDVTDADGIIEVDLPAGDYVLVEGAEGEEGPSQAFTIESGSVTAIVVLNVEGDEDEGEVKILKFVCPGEEDEVVFYEEGDETIPDLTECEVGDATFTIDDGEEFTTENGGALVTVSADVEHTLTEVLPNQGSTTFTVADGERVTIIVINFEGEDEEDRGSVTINKQLEECEVCEAFTPGFWFNRGGGGGVDWANDWLDANPQVISGIGTFDSVASVQAYLDADRDGEDGAQGLSATGQLLRHYLALVLNVASAEADGCDLGSLEFEGMTISEWLDAALTALEEGASDAEKLEIKDALDAINNSDAGDGTLECDDAESGPHAGVMFELYDAEDMLVDSGTTGEDGSLVLDGDPDGTGLPLGTYTLVEVSNDADLECTIVSVDGEGATLNEDGTVTIVLTESVPDVTITVVNDCEEQPGGEEDEFGHISVVKATNEEDPAEEFTFEATWDQDGFTLMDGDLEPSGELLAGVQYTVTEDLTEDGWSLEDITCEGAAAWDVSDDGMSVTITLGADEDVVCTFTNELADEGEQPSGNETPREGTQGGAGGPSGGLPNTATPAPTGSVPAALVALLMLAGLGATGYAVRAEVARRR